MKTKLYQNGKEIKESLLLERLDPHKVCLFETLRTYNGNFFRLGEHLARLKESARDVAWEYPIDLEKVEKEIKTAVQAFGDPDVSIRLTIFEEEIYVFVGKRGVPQNLYDEGAVLKTSSTKRSPSHAFAPEAKTSAYQNSLLAGLGYPKGDAHEWLFLDAYGFVAEVRVGNLFIVSKGALKTPPLPGILNGVTRRFVIECALSEGVQVKEEPLTRHDLYIAEEAFLTNTSWEILPIRSLDGRRIGEKIPGSLTEQLQRSFKKKVLKECPVPS